MTKISGCKWCVKHFRQVWKLWLEYRFLALNDYSNSCILHCNLCDDVQKTWKKTLPVINDCGCSDEWIRYVHYAGSGPESEWGACPHLWRTVIKKEWAQRSPGPRGAIGIRKQHKRSSEGPEEQSVRLEELATSQRAAGPTPGSPIHSPLLSMQTRVMWGPSPVWSSTKTGVFKRAPNKIFLGLCGASVPVLIRGLPPAW